MPRPTKLNQLQVRKRPAPVEESPDPGSDGDSPEELTKDQQRALKRFKAGMDDDGSDGAGDGNDSEDDDEDDGGGTEEADDESDEGESGDDSDDSGDSAGDSDGDDDKRTLEDQVADVPFEMLETLRQDGRGLVGQAARAAAARDASRTFKRVNKDRPQELSSKRPVGRFREVIQIPHKEARDPRFDSSGPPATDTFRRRYSFIYNETLPKEKAELQAKLKKEKDPKFKARLQSQIQRVDTTLRDEDLRRRTQKLESEWKSKERGAVASGKSPFFLKAADKKRLGLLAKYQELKERGKLDKFMEKRRKKNASKDHRYLPSFRREQQDE